MLAFCLLEVFALCAFLQKLMHFIMKIVRIKYFLIPLVGLKLKSLFAFMAYTAFAVRAVSITDLFCFNPFGGLKWTRTTDLTLIRRAL